MKQFILKVVFLALFVSSSSLFAADFDWMKGLNKSATSNMEGYKSKLSSRFKLAKSQVGFFMKGVRSPADAYMVLRLSEISGKFPESVLETYQQKRSQGWVKLAQYVGVKSSSQQFQALRVGHDLQAFDTKQSALNKSKEKEKKKSKIRV